MITNREREREEKKLEKKINKLINFCWHNITMQIMYSEMKS